MTLFIESCPPSTVFDRLFDFTIDEQSWFFGGGVGGVEYRDAVGWVWLDVDPALTFGTIRIAKEDFLLNANTYNIVTVWEVPITTGNEVTFSLSEFDHQPNEYLFNVNNSVTVEGTLLVVGDSDLILTVDGGSVRPDREMILKSIRFYIGQIY
jgi:hypothetical protein